MKEIQIFTKKGAHRQEQKELINKIRDYINFKNMEPGDRLPSERVLSEKFGVTRTNLREAFKVLEFYGLLDCVPQSGTFMANIGRVALNGMITDILNLGDQNFKSLVETRILLELKTVKLAALNRTEEQLKYIQETLEAYAVKAIEKEDAVQEDLLFHLAIAKASGNSTINGFMLSITPKIIMDWDKYQICDKNQAVMRLAEHKAVFEAIKNKNPEEAESKMKLHFKSLYEYCYDINS